MFIENLVLEITRKCNMNCAHCMRGSRRSDTLNKSTMYQLFDKVDHVGSLTITGGEPSLAIQQIKELADVIDATGTVVDYLYIVHNGKAKTDKLLIAFDDLVSVCQTSETSYFTISNDFFHYDERTPWTEVELEELEETTPITNSIDIEFHTDNTTYRNYRVILPRGRATDFGMGSDDIKDFIIVDNDYAPTKIIGNCYITCHGDVLADNDLAYKEMPKHSFGNINNWDELLNKLIAHTRKRYLKCQRVCNAHTPDDLLNECDSWAQCSAFSSLPTNNNNE